LLAAQEIRLQFYPLNGHWQIWSCPGVYFQWLSAVRTTYISQSTPL